MKYNIVITILLSAFLSVGFPGTVSAQSVGVITRTPDRSAALDIDVSGLPAGQKKGMLLPRVALQNRTDNVTIPNPATGLTVYNTNSSSTDPNGVVGPNDVEANMYYFWDGTKWLDMTNIDIVVRELYPQVFFILTNDYQSVGAQLRTLNNEVVVTFPSGFTPMLNTGNNISLDNATSRFTVLNKGTYEISGLVGYNPNFPGSGLATGKTNLEFIIQVSSNNGGSWTNIARTVSMWGNNTVMNSRHLIISPVVVSLDRGNLIRAVVKRTQGDAPGNNAQLNPAGGLSNAKMLKIQRLD